MSPLHPPSKRAKPTAENIAKLEAWLNAITAFSTYTSEQPWIFYEEIDKYLGPWGPSAYPTAYGKKYCVLFYEDEDLRRSAVGRAWVRRTLILLQESLKKLVMERFRQGNLDGLTAAEFQKVAFESHAAAYTDGGLALVAMLSRRLTLHVAMIPGKEFLPGTNNFRASWRQVFETGGILVPQALAVFFSVWSFPTHTDAIARAHRYDVTYSERVMELSDALRDLRHAVEAGRMDHVYTLDRLISIVAGMRWPDNHMASAAQDTLRLMERRRMRVIGRYRREVESDPTLLPIYKSFDVRAF